MRVQMNGWCNYRELYRQLKEQFIHGLNDKCMSNEIIRELTAKINDEQVTSDGMLIWAKRIKVQRAQAVILSNITESHQFDKVKVTQRSKEDNVRCTSGKTNSWCPCRYCGGIHAPRQCPAYGKMCTGCTESQAISRWCAGAEGREPWMIWRSRRWMKSTRAILRQ